MKQSARAILLVICLILFGVSACSAKELESYGDGTALPVNMRLFLRDNQLWARLALVNNTGHDIEVYASMLEQSAFEIYKGSYSPGKKIPPDKDVVNYAADRERQVVLKPLDSLSATVSVSEYYQLETGVEYIIFFFSYIPVRDPGEPDFKLGLLKSSKYKIRLDDGKLTVHDYP